MTTIENAICNSQKLKITLYDGQVLTVHPYFILEKARNSSERILRGYIEGAKPTSCDLPVEKIRSTDILQEHYAIDQSCLYFNFDEYEIVFPRQEDLSNCQ
jgi:hypothetical protein